MEKFEGFEYEPRKDEYLPENWIKKEKNETSWFLNSYKNKNVDKNQSCLFHIKEGLREYKINC